MADDDQQPPAQRYWFPYWTSPPQPPPPAPRPAGLRPQPSRRDTRPAPPVAPSPSRRPSHPTQDAPRGAGAASPQAQPQPTRLPSRPSPSRAAPLAPIREPNAGAALAPVATEPKTPVKPTTPPHPSAHEVPKQKDIIIPQEKIIHEPPADSKPHSKAIGEEKDKEKEEKKDKDQENEKDKGKEKEKEKKEKEKDKDKDNKKEKEKAEKKEKEKDHKEKKEKDKEEIKTKETVARHDVHDESKYKEVVEESAKKASSHGGKLHKELKAGVTDMVQKLGVSEPSSGHERPAAAGATVITLAGENKGASMKISHAEADSKADTAGKDKERRAHKLDATERKEAVGAKGLTAFVNSNVQVINNSLLFQSSCSGGDPGVHLKLSTKAKKTRADEEAGDKSGSTAAAAPKKMIH